MRKVCILKGSPRKDGNTNALTDIFADELKRKNCEVTEFFLYDMELNSCLACRNCQKDWSTFGCVHNDDMQQIFDCVMESDLIVIASPIYAWYCTAPTKAVIDRLVYGMNKFYGEEYGPALWEGKEVALITTCGYKAEKGADLWEEGMKRYCKHSKLVYRGMLVERHLGYNTIFMDSEKERHAVEFVKEFINE